MDLEGAIHFPTFSDISDFNNHHHHAHAPLLTSQPFSNNHVMFRFKIRQIIKFKNMINSYRDREPGSENPSHSRFPSVPFFSPFWERKRDHGMACECDSIHIF
jgi:hypothetical protein